MSVFFKQWRCGCGDEDLDLTRCPGCGCHFLDENALGVCDKCAKAKADTKAVIRRMTTDIVRFLRR